jgi:hypothetical protein
MRDWWLRTLLVLQRPRPVFVALRDTSDESLADRAEPVLAIVILAGIALVLQTSTAAHLVDSNQYDGLVIAIWAFFAGLAYGGVGYWVAGGFLHWAARSLGSQGDYQRTRHVLAFAAVPIALSLVLWPVKIALYGEDNFRTGGRDTGAGAHVFTVLDLAFIAWAGLLLVIGIRAVHGWTWQRALATCALGLGGPTAVGILLSYL